MTQIDDKMNRLHASMVMHIKAIDSKVEAMALKENVGPAFPTKTHGGNRVSFGGGDAVQLYHLEAVKQKNLKLINLQMVSILMAIREEIRNNFLWVLHHLSVRRMLELSLNAQRFMLKIKIGRWYQNRTRTRLRFYQLGDGGLKSRYETSRDIVPYLRLAS
jgi:hypothetical protein